MSDFFDFDSDLGKKEIPVRYQGRDYVLREASEGAAIKWRNAQMKAARFNQHGQITGAEGLADTEPLLVSYCLFETDTGNPVHFNTICGWPAKMVKKLFQKAVEISDLHEDVPGRKALRAALKREDTPVPLEVFAPWARRLAEEDPEQFKVLALLVKPDPEELAGNVPASTAATSEPAQL